MQTKSETTQKLSDFIEQFSITNSTLSKIFGVSNGAARTMTCAGYERTARWHERRKLEFCLKYREIIKQHQDIINNYILDLAKKDKENYFEKHKKK